MPKPWCFVSLLAVLWAPAFADIQATYIDDLDDQKTLTIELADDGALRVSTKGYALENYYLFVGGHSYVVNPGPGGPDTVTIEAAAEQARRHKANTIEIGGTGDKPTPIEFAPVDTATVAGHEGIRYNFPTSYDPEMTWLILSDDPKLLPLGKAYATYRQATAAISPFDDDTESNLLELLVSHGVLKVWEHQLKSVSFAPIPRSRFAVPSPPLTLAEVMATPEPLDPSADGDAGPNPPFVTSAAFHGSTLYTLLSNGQLQSWTENAPVGQDVDLPGPARALCDLGGTFFVVTDHQQNGKTRLWTGEPGTWSLALELATTDADPFIGLDCTGPKPAMISGQAIRLGGQSHAITPPAGMFGFPAGGPTLQHGGFLYVGRNAGEFGGGLLRYPLAGGRGSFVEASGRGNVCGGLLNKDCDPVTGLAADPAHPECILAAVGLVHFMPQGSVVRVCPDGIALAYAKPYTLEPDWTFDPADVADTPANVAFYSLSGGMNHALAVASDGTYRFGTGTVPDFTPFPRVFTMPASGIDWSNPDFVLLLTTMNRRYSVSGASLILVPR
jgi:hypothetical protein